MYQQQQCYQQPQQDFLPSQFVGLSLQDPAFLQELQRVDTLRYQTIQPQQQQQQHNGELQQQMYGVCPQQPGLGTNNMQSVGGAAGKNCALCSQCLINQF